MDERDTLAGQFEEHRSHLRAVAYRLLGSQSEADDAVQEAWLRLSRADAHAIRNLGGWLTTTVARLCLDMLRSRTARREEPLDTLATGPVAGGAGGGDPEREALLADAVGLALVVVLDTLAPAERLAFVLHDLFAVPFDEIAPIVERTPEAARQLASRARRRVRGTTAAPEARVPSGQDDRQRTLVDAFLAASRGGDFAALVAVLAPDVVLRADGAAVAASAAAAGRGGPELLPELRGAEAVARAFVGRAQAARPARVDGAAGAVFAPGGAVRAAFRFTVAGGRIAAVEVIADPAHLRTLDLAVLGT